MALTMKRAIDVAGSTTGLLVCLPFFLLFLMLIKLESPGSGFYRGVRAGRKGQTFRCWKFRTMVQDADQLKDQLRIRNERNGATFKVSNDPRITRLGRMFRRFSLDELPQLWNVLKGEMSLVGPRPHPVDDVERYRPLDRRRLDVTPGITGLWQVLARRDPSFARNLELDVAYIENWTLHLDLRILLGTIPAVLRGTGV